MKDNFRKFSVFSSLFILILLLLGCTIGAIDSAAGTYYLVYEDGPLMDRVDVDYYMMLDGKGSGEYHKDDKVHKINYKFDNPNITITDNLTGIKYSGTLSEGELLIYDGKIDDPMTSEYLFRID